MHAEAGERSAWQSARVLRAEVSDTRVSMVTLTHVDVAPDLSHAVVQWSLFDKEGEPEPEKLAEIEDGLVSAAGFVRRKVAKVLALRKMPALRFRYDPSMRWAGETMELLNAIKSGSTTEEGPEEGSE